MLQPVTCKISEDDIAYLDQLVKNGYAKTRSEAIRSIITAVRINSKKKTESKIPPKTSQPVKNNDFLKRVR